MARQRTSKGENDHLTQLRLHLCMLPCVDELHAGDTSRITRATTLRFNAASIRPDMEDGILRAARPRGILTQASRRGHYEHLHFLEDFEDEGLV